MFYWGQAERIAKLGYNLVKSIVCIKTEACTPVKNVGF